MTENLLEKIQADFKSAFEKDTDARKSLKKIKAKKAGFTDADTVTKSAGKALRGAFEKYAADFSDAPALRDVLTETLGENYDLINKICADVQAIADERCGINLKPQRADFPASRVENLAKYTAGRDLKELSAARNFGAAVENVNNSIYTDYIRTNAEFRAGAGLKVVVSRSEGAGCCSWCSKLTGTFELEKAPKDFWRRHKNCTCVIDYINEKTGRADRITYADYHDKKNPKRFRTKKITTRLTPEQARKLQDRVLTGGANGGIIEENKQCEIAPDKINKFLLKPGAKHSKEFFDVGYKETDFERLNKELRECFDYKKAVDKIILDNGAEKFSIFVELGVTKKKRFRTVWQKDNQNSIPRLITAHREDE